MMRARQDREPSADHRWTVAFVALILTLALPACNPVSPTGTAKPTPTPNPDGLDPVQVRAAVAACVDQARAERGLEALPRDETLAGLAEDRAAGIAGGAIDFDTIGEGLADELGEEVGELRACLSEGGYPPEAIAQAAVEHWLALHGDILLGRWGRAGVGFAWGCPEEGGRGAILVVLFARPVRDEL